MLVLNTLMAVMPWGSVYLSLILALTYLLYRPHMLLHPNNMVFGFYGLYVILSSTLNLILHLIDWQYVLPWGQLIYWDRITKYTLFQAEFTFLVLFFGFRYFAADDGKRKGVTWTSATVSNAAVFFLYVLTMGLTFRFIQVTAGLTAWLTDYSATYLSMREGHGLLNLITIMFGNVTIFLLGVKNRYAEKKRWIILAALLLMIPLSFIGGVKSRFIFLLIMFLSPYFMEMKLDLRRLALLAVSFFTLLYLGTLVRTQGFYASAPYFLEMMIGYFNSFQLHDSVVTSRDPGLLQTVFQVFTKPLQVLGFITDPNAEFDISVMLTKEFFPDQWYESHGTQQWPLDTELYLNYYGFYLSWVPLLIYGWAIAWLYRSSVLRHNYYLMPIFITEFIRIFSTMRGTLLPAQIFMYVIQYLIIYLCCRIAIRKVVDMQEGKHADQR
jgi:hypothetical protein